MKGGVLYLLILVVLTQHTSAQWENRNNGLPGWSVADAIDACDSLTAVISIRSDISENLFITKDAGLNWEGISFPYNWAVDVEIADTNNLWFTTGDGKIYGTTDGGENWALQFSDSSQTTFMNYIEMFDAENGVAMGDAPFVDDHNLNEVLFTNENNGFIVGREGKLLQTTDGGENWILNENFPDLDFYDIFFTNESNGWIAGAEGAFLITLDGGSSWTQIEDVTTRNLNSVHFINEQTGWMCGSLGTILKTTDGGLTWEDKSPDAYTSFFNAIDFSDSLHGWTAGSKSTRGIMFRTTDGGESWIECNLPVERVLQSLDFINADTGWVTGQGGTVLKTTDGGENLAAQTTPVTASLNSVTFLNNDNGWIVGGNGTIIKTNDGGENWIAVDVEEEATLNSIFFTESGNSWIVGNAIPRSDDNVTMLISTDQGITWERTSYLENKPALFLRTTNGGRDWVSMNDSSLYWSYSRHTWHCIDFIDLDNGFFYASGPGSENDALFRTNDGGQTWLKLDCPAVNVDVVKFFDENIGFVYFSLYGSDSQVIYRTTDGGISWDEIVIGNTSMGDDIEFNPANPAEVWFTDMNNLFFSSDTGSTWTQQESSVGTGRDIHMTDKDHVWVLCDNSNIYYGSFVNPVVGINDAHSLPQQFHLAQNYPNPFNPTTTIKYSLPVSSSQFTVGNNKSEMSQSTNHSIKQSNVFSVSLKVYDILGREVATLVDAEQKPGTYEVRFDGSSLASGVYFYKLQADNYVNTMKMILLK